MSNYWLDRKKPTALDRVSTRRSLMYLQKQVSALWREKLSASAPDYWFQAKLTEMMDDLRSRRLFSEYEYIISDDLVMVGIQPREHLPWITIEMELKICNNISV